MMSYTKGRKGPWGGIRQLVRSDLNIVLLLKSLLTQFGIPHLSLNRSLLRWDLNFVSDLVSTNLSLEWMVK
jgi:hypothetical protein